MRDVIADQKNIVKKFKIKGIYIKRKYYTKTFNKTVVNTSKLG